MSDGEVFINGCLLCGKSGDQCACLERMAEQEDDIEQLGRIIITQRVALREVPKGCDEFVCIECGKSRRA